MLRSSLFMVFVAAGRCFAMDRLLPVCQYFTKFSLEDTAVSKYVGAPCCHHPDEVGNQVGVYVWRDLIHHVLHVPVRRCVVLTQVSY